MSPAQFSEQILTQLRQSPTTLPPMRVDEQRRRNAGRCMATLASHRLARQANKTCIPGALTPTEVVRAWQVGADMVKIFPCGAMGGPAYIKALKGPFPHIDFVPTGGVTVASVAEFIAAGVAALGVGGDLLAGRALEQGGPDLVRANTLALLDAVRSTRNSRRR